MTSQLRHPRTLLVLAAITSLLTLGGCGSGKASAEGTLDKTLTVDGPAHLQLTAGSGDSTITVGAPGEIRVHGDISVHSFSAESGRRRIDEIIANPPVKQQGNLIRVGVPDGGMNNVSIDWTITVPPDTDLHAESGSGDLTIDGIKGAANLALGSGAVKVSNVGGDVELRVGSGDVDLSNIGGEITGNAGSGGVQFATVKGNVRFEAGLGRHKRGRSWRGRRSAIRQRRHHGEECVGRRSRAHGVGRSRSTGKSGRVALLGHSNVFRRCDARSSVVGEPAS